jgi:KUP system potassium uptake protein
MTDQGEEPGPPAEEEPEEASFAEATTPGAEAVEARAGDTKTEPVGKYLALLSLGALGVVFGDIGTSPLYALREAFHGPHAIALTPGNIYGVLSLITWALILVVSIKYLAFVMRADNRGEGGILALLALVLPPRSEGVSHRRRVLIVLGLFGSALLYGDGLITPAITVLSAVEGLDVVTPFFRPYVIPIVVVVLVGLFMLQSRGTGTIGRVFGPVMVLWFVAIGVLGAASAFRAPAIFGAINPWHAVTFFHEDGTRGFLVLGAVVLALTGAEALYADMGHFGRRPIRLAWFALALPALMLNYFGQGALLLSTPGAESNPFFHLAPEWALVPMVVLATAAAVIASQSLISGVFSITRQAAQLGYTPRVRIEHTSAREIGQIYVPGLNWVLMLGCIGLVVGFRSSSNLAAAYGVAVTGTMAITTMLFHSVARHRWGWSPLAAGSLAGVFLIIDLAFFGANIVKIAHGGWFPLVVAAFVYLLMSTWKRGRVILAERLSENTIPVQGFITSLMRDPPHRVPGTAVFMFGNPGHTPPALLHNLKHNKVLHEQVVLLTVRTGEVPHVAPEDRVKVEPLGHGFHRVAVHYGFMESPDIPEVLAGIRQPGLSFSPMTTSYFLGRETLIASEEPGMAMWREHIFAWMARNAQPATAFFRLPPNRVVELGAQVKL